MKRTREDSEFVVLVPDMLTYIFALTRQNATPVHRARLRCVSKALHAADLTYTPPAWVHTHPDLATLPLDTPAYRYFCTFVADACANEKWSRIARPLEIRWDTRLGYGIVPRNELRILWPPFYYHDILHVRDFHYSSGEVEIYYTQGSTHDKERDDNVWDEYMGSSTSYFRWLDWNMLPKDICDMKHWPEPVWV